MRYFLFFILTCTISCLNQADEGPLKKGQLEIRIENKTNTVIDHLAIEDFVFEKIAPKVTTEYVRGKAMKITHIEEFMPIIKIEEQTYSRDIGLCGTPPIAQYKMSGSFKIVIEDISLDQTTFNMTQHIE